LERLLNDSEKLKTEARANWDVCCRAQITSTEEIQLTGALANYFDKFDFAIFSSLSVLDLVKKHEKTGYHAVRFGGGLPPRPVSAGPPPVPASHESRYLRQLLDAYGDHENTTYLDASALSGKSHLQQDFLRQRERFITRKLCGARDTVPEGTSDALQDEVYHAVIDVSESSYSSGFLRMKATVAHATAVALFRTPSRQPSECRTSKEFAISSQTMIA
jgi:hypothetical protein